MASRELRFDVSALDQASKVFVKMASAVDRFERRLDKLDGKTVDAQVDVDTRRAEDKVGRFATDLRRRVQNAVDSIPPIDIDANSTEADRKLADVRRRMQELRDVRIGIDLSADEAIRRSRDLQRELEEISRSDPRVDVRANTDAAARDLAEINREVDRLDGREAVVRVRTDGSILDSTRHITRLGAAMRAIAIPSAILVGTPALVSLGGAAASAASSLLLLPAAGNAAGLAVGTLVTAFQGFGEAVGDDPEKAAEALAKLTPAARSAATEINRMKPALADIRKSVQETFFAGLGPRIGELGSKYLPIVSAATTRVAGQFNVAGDQVLQFLNHAHTVGQVRESFTSLGTVIGNLTPTILPLTSVLTDVGTVGAKVLADITGGAEGAATSFANMVSRARESGAMEASIRRGLDELKRFGTVAGNVGGIVSAMYRAGQVSGNDFLGTLVNITGRMRDFLSSAQGQTAMVGIFTGVNQAVTALTPGLEAVGRAIGQIATNKATSGALTAMATAFSDLLVAAAPTAVAISRVVSAGIQPLAGALSFLAPVIGPVVGGLLAMKAASSTLNFLAAATGLKTLGSAAVSMTGNLRGAATAATTVGTNAGTAAASTGRAATAFGRVQTVAGKLGNALPLVGLAFIAADTAVQATTVSLDEAVDAHNRGGAAADEMRRKVEEQTHAFGGNQNAVELAANKAADWIRSTLFGVATVDTYNAAIEEQNRVMHESVGATGIARSSFDQIKGSMDQSKEAAQGVTDSLALIGPAMAGIKDGVAPTKEMDTALKGVATAAGEAAQKAGESAAKLGGVDAGAKAAASSMQTSRDAFIQTATGAGMTEKAAGELADKLGMIPKTAETNFRTNAATTALEVQQVADKLRDVPVGKSVTVNAMTDGAKAALTGLGIQVETMKDGTVKVTADTAQAQANMAAFINGTRDQRAEVQIDGQTAPAATALQNVLQLVASGRERINIDGNDQPARGVLSHLLGMVQGKNVKIEIGGNAVPAEQVVNGLIQAIDTKSPTVDIGGNKIPFDQVMSSLAANTGTPVVKDINGNAQPLLNVHGTALGAITAPATKPLVGDPAGILGANDTATGAIQTPAIKPIEGSAGAALAAAQDVHNKASAPATKPMGGNNTGGLSANELLTGAVQTPATKPIGGNNAGGVASNQALKQQVESQATKPINGNNAGGMGQNQSLVGAVQAPATKPVNANTGGAISSINALRTLASAAVTMTVNVVKSFLNAEGGIVPMEQGGVIPMADGGGPAMPKSFGGNRLNPMSTTAQIVRPQTWRVVGDRAQGDEAYIPLVPSSTRSKAILKVAAGRMGYDLVPAGSISTAASLRGPGVASSVPQLADIRARVQAAVIARSTGSTTVQLPQLGALLAVMSHVDQRLQQLRGDVVAAGRTASPSPDVVEALEGLAAVLPRMTSTSRSAGVRDLGEIGGW
ncbi:MULTISPECIES: hypothetical protein [unclassified Pseudonocardia]|uniref:hypothetical protein n=1 Tax=unclassified Pseudonocardia TaxID=2619320 RepID=UPI0001FFE2C0|nr:hypothetical protein [Pseudonocardia sp. Ae707_Ps1]OLM20860.1 minor tail protein [Pseudonocardia sp. Ae707_Ps1]